MKQEDSASGKHDDSMTMTAVRKVISFAPFGALLYHLTDDGKLIFEDRNSAAEEILKIELKNYIGSSLEEVFPPLAETEIPSIYRRLAREGGTYHDEHITYSDDKGIAGAYDIHAFQTAPCHMAVFFTDITERKQTELQLQQSEEKLTESTKLLNKAQEIAGLGHYIMRFPSGEMELSENGYKLFGLPPKKNLSYTDWKELLDGDQMAMEAQHRKSILNSKIKRLDREYKAHRLSDNKEIWIHDLGTIEFSEDGQSSKITGTFQDITKKKIAEETILRKTEELDRFFDLSKDLLCIAGMDGFFRRLNKEWQKVLGYSLAELEGAQFLDLVHPEDRESTIAIVETLEKEKIAKDFINRYSCKDGSYVYLEWNAYRFHDIIYSTARNVSDRIRYEEELKEAKRKAEESDRLKSAFLANMSHEIRTPMNGIIGFAELLSAPDIEENEREEFIRIINNSSRQLLNIVNDILDISKIEIGQVEIHKKELDLTDLVTDVIRMYQPLAQENDNTLIFELVDKSEKMKSVSDSQKVRQIVGNLISNALKFTTAGTVSVKLKKQTGNFCISVKDTGIGISEQDRERIFDRFSQAEQSPDGGPEGGTGLGLAISRAFAELLGGSLTVHSRLHEGSEFRLTLPAEAVAQTRPPVSS